MRAVGLRAFGGPEVLELVEVDDVHAGPGQVRIRSHAFTVNPADTLRRSGRSSASAAHPVGVLVPGMDVAGVVDEIGEGTVTNLAIGDAVMAMLVPRGTHGGYAEHVVLPADAVAAIPAGTTFAEASTLPMNGLTAKLTLDTLALPPGAVLAVTGAAGCYGGYVLQLASAAGLTTVGDASPADTELVARLGADIVVPRGDDVASAIRVHFQTGTDALADGALQQAIVVPAVADGGQFASVRGWPGNDERSIAFHQIMVTTYEARADLLRELAGQVECGAVTLRVAEEFAPERTADAHRILEAGGTRGRLVVVWDD